jgi:ribonuclease HI
VQGSSLAQLYCRNNQLQRSGGIKDFAQIQEAAVNHFRNLLSAERNGDEEDETEFLSAIPNLVSVEDNVSLMSPVTEEEITNIVWSMDPDKAPGPDGFSIHFYRICWEIIKFDLFRMIRGVFRKAKMGGGTKSTFLALIPKETNPRSFDRYRPISLCNSSYKIVAKLLANRIKPLLQKLISPAQGGFVKGRQILDNVIQIQEALHSSHARKEQGMIIKLDMSNAFDRVNRSFLLKVLEAFGFSHEFLNIIKACIENVWIAPMVNGRPTDFFSATRGLRQGCPLSPFLYILMADSLSRKLTQEQLCGTIPGIRIVQGAPPVNHALFADDSLLLGGASLRMAKAFKTILQKYCSVTGALISERKSAVYGWNTDQQTIDRIASELGFKGYAEWDKIKYLGLPLTMGSNRNNLWEEVISKFKKKIAAWGGVWLSSGGKLTLIRSVLSALPTFQASLLLAPRQIADQISCLIRNFLWSGGKGNSNRFHLVNWELVKRPINEGGLQIRDPLQANLALGCKILWQLTSEPTHPISQILILKYLRNKSIITFNPASSPKGTLAWSLCCRGIDFFRMHLYKIPGNGKKTRLWRDRIMGHHPLSEINEIADLRVWLRARGIRKIEDIVEWEEDGNWKGWNLPNIPEHLKDQLNLFTAEIADFAPVHKNEEDTWGWGQTGVYSAKQGYLQMQSKKDSVHPEGVWKQIWECFSIPKINFFFWTLFQNKILTGENLCKRNILGPHRCVFCKKALETTVHIFLECEYAQKTWTSFLTGLNVRPPVNSSISEMFVSWKARYPHSIAAKSLWSKVWTAVPKYVCWKLWLSRNDIIFNQTEITAEKVAGKAKNLLIETLRQSRVKDNSLRDEESIWLGGFTPTSSPSSFSRPIPKENWQIRDNLEGFQKWWKSQGKCTIFFDGASKGNPGRSGAGGIIYLPNGSKESFSWGLGIKTNNQAEVLSLLKACQLARKRNPKEIVVFGDSELLIKALRKNKRFNDPALNKQMTRVIRLLKEIPSVQIFHILRELNSEADSLANIGCNLEKSMISINSGEPIMVAIP